MQQMMIRNGTPFPMQQLKVIKGKVPQSIQGSYIKNGPGLYTLGEQVIPHWFIGNGGLLKVQFHDGKAFGKYKMTETPSYKRDITQKNFNRQNVLLGGLKKVLGFGAGKNDDISNSANTSILRKPNSDTFYTLYEGGLPFAMEQKTLNEKGFEDFGFIRKGFSAHPKVDPDNGDIFNIGFNANTFDVYRMTKDFKLLAKNTTKLRVPQSIHDCCLAGDYLIVFECPVKLDMWKFVKGYFGPKCYSADFNYGKTIAYIYNKENLQLVKRMQFMGEQIFFMFHFTNGYVENNKIFVEYVKYPGQNAQTILQYVDYIPNYAKKEGQKKQFQIFSQLQTLEINLQDFSYKFHTQDISCEFPLCQDHEVGKKWRYSYAAAGEKGVAFQKFDKLLKFDRESGKAEYKHYPGNCVVEPSLIRTNQGLYILILKSSPQRCSLQILEGEKLQTVAQIELPEYIPYGFHGKWLRMQNRQFLETSKL